MVLNRGEHADPLYVQVARRLSAQIAAGDYAVGDKLPSEPSLAAKLAVSRATIVKAFNELEHVGAVDRRQGKGTYVAERPLEHGLNEIDSFTEVTMRSGSNPAQKLLEYRLSPAGEDRDDLLQNFAESTDLVVLTRLRLSDGLPVGLHRIALPRDVLAQVGLRREEFDAEQLSIYQRLARHGLQPIAADEWLRAIPAPADIAKHLGTQAGTALMRARRLSKNRTGDLVEAVDAFYLGSLYEYHAVLSAPLTASEKGNLNEENRIKRSGNGVRAVAP